MKTSKGVVFLIDDDDDFAVSKYAWHIDQEGYPSTNGGKWPQHRPIRLHQFLLGRAPDGFVWDHVSRDKLDNRRSNLRLVTYAGNARNASLNRHNTSGFRGVRWHKHAGLWQARIGRRSGGRKGRLRETSLGYYSEKADAIAARLAAESVLWRDEASDYQAEQASFFDAVEER